MIKTSSPKELIKKDLFFSKYPFNNSVKINQKVIYEGTINNCPKDLLEGLQINPKHKFIRVWL